MRKLILALFLIFSLMSVNYADGAVSIGTAADWAMGPINSLGKIFGYMCLIGGVGMVLGAFLQYRAHRDNPSQVRLGTPIFLLIVGLILLILPFIGVISGYKDALIRYY